MNNLSSIKMNVDNSIINLKREWSIARESWNDSKSKEYERIYLTPIVMKQKKITSDIEALEKISDKLKKLGVEV